MLTTRVAGAGASISCFGLDAPRRRSCSSCSRRRARRTCRRPPAARGPPRALPPLRLRSWPQPQRITAGEVVPYHSASVARSRGVDAGFGGRALDRPRLGGRAQLVGAGRVRREERLVGPAALEQLADRARARPAGRCPGRTARCRSACRASGVRRGSTTTSLAPCFCARLMCGTRWMPDADGLQPQTTISRACVVVLVGDAGHLAVHRRGRRAGRRGAHRAREPRGAEAPEEPRVLEVVA